MRKLKVMTILGTRPEIIRLSEVIKACDKAFDHVLVHTGQNYDYTLNEIFFQDLGLRDPDHFLDAARGTLGQNIGRIIERSFDVISLVRPDAILILGDTNSALSAIPAKRLKVPIFHMEAGNRCFDPNVPEEINRRIVDHTSDINLAYTEHSRRNLLHEGLPTRFTFVTGSPMKEVIDANREKIRQSRIVDALSLKPGNFFVVSAHREENLDSERKFVSLVRALNGVADEHGRPMVFSTHPRTATRISATDVRLNPLIRQIDPLGFTDYVALQKASYCVLSDSGTVSEESAILSFPAVLLRDSTERPEAVDAGTIVIGSVEATNVLQSIEQARFRPTRRESLDLPADYRGGQVSDKVVRILQSYTPIVATTVWHKDP